MKAASNCRRVPASALHRGRRFLDSAHASEPSLAEDRELREVAVELPALLAELADDLLRVDERHVVERLRADRTILEDAQDILQGLGGPSGAGVHAKVEDHEVDAGRQRVATQRIPIIRAV